MLHNKNYFELFGFPVSFDLDMAVLTITYRQLQRQFHPDKYAAASDHEKRIALQYSTYINEAYECLKSPIARAQYLMELAGFSQKNHTMQNDTVFLLQQMEWREQLDSLHSREELDALLNDTRLAIEEYLQQFDIAYRQKKYAEAQQNIDKMQFVIKFEKELGQHRENF